MQNKREKMKFKLTILFIFLVIFVFSYFFVSKKIISPSKNAYKATLNNCVDGDTAVFNIDDEIFKVRFLAINTPENNKEKIEFYGPEASAYTCKILKEAAIIELEYDGNSTKTDKYNRHLMWVFADGVLVQKNLVENGYAEIKYIKGKYKYLDELINLQAHAKRLNKGIWSK